MLDTSLGDGGTFCVLWKPQTRSMQFHASIPPPHLALRGSVDDNCTYVHPQRCWPCVFSCLLPICASSLPHDLPTIVCLVPAQQQWPNFSRSCQFFPPPAARLSLASSFACGGPRRAIFGQLSLGGVFLLHDSSRPARRTAKAWRLRPARGTAPRVSGSHRSVLHSAFSGAAAAATTAVTTAAAATAGRCVRMPRAHDA